MSTHGYVPYRPRRYTAQVLQATKNILVTYEAWNSPLTVRQVFYRLVAEYEYDKTEAAYDALVGYVSRARRAYMHSIIETVADGHGYDEAQAEALAHDWLLPFEWIRDEKGQSVEPQTWEDAEDYLGTVRKWAGGIQLDRQTGQPRVVELWCEAAGMVPLMSEIAKPYSIQVSSGGGYDSVTAKHQLAKRVRVRAADGQNTTVLHIGDFDPSGEGMYETLGDDVGAMVWDTGGNDDTLRVERVALREDQVIGMDVTTAPPKPKDSRTLAFIAKHPEAVEYFGSTDITAQLEALTPPDLRTLVEGAITSHLVTHVRDEVLEEEAGMREQVIDRLDGKR